MAQNDTTTRTKAAVGEWCNRESSALTLDDKLNNLRRDAYGQLREYINDEFSHEKRFPISRPEWEALSAKTIRDVRDEALRRLA